MAVAGGAVSASRCMLDANGVLRISSSSSVQGSVVLDVDGALAELEAGRSCYLEMRGSNYTKLKAAWMGKHGYDKVAR